MPPKSVPKSWGGRLGVDAAAPEEQPPLDIPEPSPMDKPLDPVGEHEARVERIRELEIRTMVLQRELHLTKARVLELELRALGISAG